MGLDMVNEIEAEAARIKASGAFSRSPSLLTLFDFLVSNAQSSQAPKDVEIAYQIFGNNAQNASTDAQVRVHVHRLRTKLKEFYSENGPGPFGTLSIPKGEYRLIIIRPVQQESRPGTDRRLMLYGAVALSAAALLAGIGYKYFTAKAKPEIGQLWRPYAESPSTIMILVGDKSVCMSTGKIFQENAAECAEGGEISHLLPESIAGAMHNIDSVLISSDSERKFRLVLASQVIPEMIRKTNVVYIGLIEDMGIIGLPLSDISRFAKNWRSNRIEAGIAKAADRPTNALPDNGYIASFPSADGNRVIIAAGTSNASVLQATETLSDPKAVKQLERAAGGRDFEAVFQVNRINQTNMGSRLIAIRSFAGAQRPGGM